MSSLDGILARYRISGYEAGSEKEIFRLFRLAYDGREFSPAAWDWRFRDNPAGALRMSNIWDGARLVGHNAFTPMAALWEGKPIISAFSGTIMADPAHPGMTLLIKRAEDALYADFDMIYGFPNPRQARMDLKVHKYHNGGAMDFYYREPLEAPKNPCVRPIPALDEQHGALFEQIKNRFRYIVCRDARYLQWRLCAPAFMRYRFYEYREAGVRGYMALNIYRDGTALHGQVVDIVAPEREAFTALIREAGRIFAAEGCALIKLWMSAPEYGGYLQSEGFSYGLHPFPMPVRRLEMEAADAYLTMADSDIF